MIDGTEGHAQNISGASMLVESKANNAYGISPYPHAFTCESVEKNKIFSDSAERTGVLIIKALGKKLRKRSYDKAGWTGTGIREPRIQFRN